MKNTEKNQKSKIKNQKRQSIGLIIVFVLIILGLTGYVFYDKVIMKSDFSNKQDGDENQKSYKIVNVDCNDLVKEVVIDNQSEVSCELLGEVYIFNIERISDDSLKITTDGIGLSSKGILNSENEWVLKKDNKLSLHTMTTDYQEFVDFSW